MSPTAPIRSPDLRVAVYAAGGKAVVAVRGGLDIATAPTLRASLIGVRARGCREVVVDLGAVPYVDASGFDVLVGAVRAIRSEGGDVVLRDPSPHVLRVLEITGLVDMFSPVHGARRCAAQDGDPRMCAGQRPVAAVADQVA